MSQMQNEKNVPRSIVEYLNNITPQLVEGFHTESNKIRYLRNAVLGKKCVATPLKNISTAQYTFDQLVMALNESIPLEKEIGSQEAHQKYTTLSSQLTLRTFTNTTMIADIAAAAETICYFVTEEKMILEVST